MHRRFLPALTLVLLATACNDGPAETTTIQGAIDTSTATTTTTAPPSTPTTTASRPPFCPVRWEQEPIGVVASTDLNEVSGAVVSRRHPGVMWLHNDSGDDAAIYAAQIGGTDVARVLLPDLSARDWEDMALGPGPDQTLDYVYLADIGDNNERRDQVLIHRIPEPLPEAGTRTGGETLQVTYPDGPMEAETLLVDSLTGDMVIAGKALSGVTPLYGLAGELDWSEPREATYLGEIMLGSFAPATGGDAGTERIVIRTYDEVFTWQRRLGESLADALFTPPCRVASVVEPQGEAIALTPDEHGFYTVSEGVNQPISRFRDGS